MVDKMIDAFEVLIGFGKEDDIFVEEGRLRLGLIVDDFGDGFLEEEVEDWVIFFH
jgi:hypothetical protein